MKLINANFKKRFSINFYRNLKLPMGEMSFHKDWLNTDGRGDPYPLTANDGVLCEALGGERYTVAFGGCGSVRRLLGAYFPWNTYDISYESLHGSIGVEVTSPLGNSSVTLSDDGMLTVKYAGKEECVSVGKRECGTLSVEFRGAGVTAYFVKDGVHEQLIDVGDDYFYSLTEEHVLADTKIHLLVSGNQGKTVISGVSWYLHAGVSQADLRPVKYEDGSPVIDGGRIFLTVSARCAVRTYQAVLSWCPTTCDFKMEGAIFFDSGDGHLSADVASSVIYDRIAKKWRIATWSNARGHIICMGESVADPRFGINIVDTLPMVSPDGEDKSGFYGFEGDEDPDMIFDGDKWRFAVCRLEEDGYHYYHFISKDLVHFDFVGRTEGYDKTGGSYVRAADGIYFACGSDFKKRAVYDLYSPDNLSTPAKNLDPDYDDGGFRGWGSIMMLPTGSRYRYVWITFDRHLGSSYNWSYGNIHVFDSETFKL